MDRWLEIGQKGPSFGGEIRLPSAADPSLFPRRIRTYLPDQPIGKDLAFRCFTEDGGYYFCKDDKDSRPIRAIDWFWTNLARHLGIATADCSVIQDDAGRTYFGSLAHLSTADEFETSAYLSGPYKNELGQPSNWLGRHLAGLYAFDLFVNNPDRCVRNFILQREGMSSRLCAIDFASGRLDQLTGTLFPVETDATVWVGRALRGTHGAFTESALEMADRIGAVPPETIQGILRVMPEEWLAYDRRDEVCAIWSDGRLRPRLAALQVRLNAERAI